MAIAGTTTPSHRAWGEVVEDVLGRPAIDEVDDTIAVHRALDLQDTGLDPELTRRLLTFGYGYAPAC